MSPVALRVLRVIAAAAVAVGGYAHYDLYNTGGYRYTPVGSMFLLDFISAWVIALLLLIGPRRLATFFGFGVSFLSLLAFVLSRGPGVPTFSGATFKESGLSPQTIHIAGVEIALVVIIVESIGILLSAFLFVVPKRTAGQAADQRRREGLRV
jgi:hypothetical protein